LKLIHKNYKDEGLRITLIHKLFDSRPSEIAYYVPELVYVAIKKPCKHMKKVLIFHAKNNESLRRLVVVLSFRFCGMCRLLLFWWSKKAQKLKMQSHSLKRYYLSDGLEFDRTSAVENQIYTLPQSYHYAHRGLTDS